jgi:prepilin-type N-terminal cleavage/methylation domain-containing protein
MKKKNGFTLIELLIVIAIFSLLIVTIFSAFRTGLLAYEKIDVSTSLYQRVRISFNLIEAELKNVFVYNKLDSGFIGGAGSIQFFTILDSYDKEGKVSSNIGYLRYEVVGNSLTRGSSEGMLASKTNLKDENELFLSGIEEMSLQFAAPSTVPGKIYEWQNLWPGDDLSQKKQLPIAVKIKIVVRQNDNNLVEFNKIIPLYAQ